MTNRIALGLVLVILLVLAADALAFGGGLPLWFGREVATLIEYLAFWR